MRIGTWNLAERWDARHLALIVRMDCDVLLLTEVSERVELPGLRLKPSAAQQLVSAKPNRYVRFSRELHLDRRPQAR